MKPKDFEIVAQSFHDVKPEAGSVNRLFWVACYLRMAVVFEKEYPLFDGGRFLAQAEDGGK